MAIHLNLSRLQIEDLNAIRELGEEQLNKVLDRLKLEDDIVLTTSKIKDALREVLDGEDQIITRVIRQLLSLNGLLRQRDLEVDEVVASVLLSVLDCGRQWSEEEIDGWNSFKSCLVELLQLKCFRVLEKTLNLSYEYANLLQSTRVITDIRPIFNEEKTEIDGAVISFTLRIQYDSADSDHGLSLTIDEGDIDHLIKQCEEAKKKAKVAQECMTKKAAINTVISGGSS